MEESERTYEMSGRSLTLIALAALALPIAAIAGCGNSDDPARPPIDTVPPAIPGDLAAWASPAQGVTLSWSANVSDPDLAGYIVYRADATGGSFRPMQTSPLTSNSWTDDHTREGQRYLYRVSARDTSQNESALSAAFEVRVPTSGERDGDVRLAP